MPALMRDRQLSLAIDNLKLMTQNETAKESVELYSKSGEEFIWVDIRTENFMGYYRCFCSMEDSSQAIYLLAPSLDSLKHKAKYIFSQEQNSDVIRTSNSSTGRVHIEQIINNDFDWENRLELSSEDTLNIYRVLEFLSNYFWDYDLKQIHVHAENTSSNNTLLTIIASKESMAVKFVYLGGQLIGDDMIEFHISPHALSAWAYVFAQDELQLTINTFDQTVGIRTHCWGLRLEEDASAESMNLSSVVFDEGIQAECIYDLRSKDMYYAIYRANPNYDHDCDLKLACSNAERISLGLDPERAMSIPLRLGENAGEVISVRQGASVTWDYWAFEQIISAMAWFEKPSFKILRSVDIDYAISLDNSIAFAIAR